MLEFFRLVYESLVAKNNETDDRFKNDTGNKKKKEKKKNTVWKK